MEQFEPPDYRLDSARTESNMFESENRVITEDGPQIRRLFPGDAIPIYHEISPRNPIDMAKQIYNSRTVASPLS